jgi:hypothetical protein
MNYTLYLKKSEMLPISTTDIFSFINENNVEETFQHGVHATFDYYKQKTSSIIEQSEESQPSELPLVKEDALVITSAGSQFAATVLNFLHRKKYRLYVARREALYDVESTWRAIQEKKDLTNIKTVYFHMEGWSKMVYAYRAKTSYNLTVQDITYSTDGI